jgi:hypothetical protein
MTGNNEPGKMPGFFLSEYLFEQPNLNLLYWLKQVDFIVYPLAYFRSLPEPPPGSPLKIYSAGFLRTLKKPDFIPPKQAKQPLGSFLSGFYTRFSGEGIITHEKRCKFFQSCFAMQTRY